MNCATSMSSSVISDSSRDVIIKFCYFDSGDTPADGVALNRDPEPYRASKEDCQVRGVHLQTDRNPNLIRGILLGDWEEQLEDIGRRPSFGHPLPTQIMPNVRRVSLQTRQQMQISALIDRLAESKGAKVGHGPP